MELKRGYKQTEVGIIPEDWEVKALFEILKFGSGKDYKHLSSGEIPVYGTGGLMTFVDHFLYQGDSVGIGRKGTIDKPVFLSGKFWTVDTLFYTHTFSGVLPKFIYYKFLLVKWKEFNEASGVPSLNKNTLDKIKISVPNISEQTAIANALSDMDALISHTEKLIEKKIAIKQGAMQELLKPKDGWTNKNLGDVCGIIGGGTPSTANPIFWNGEINWFTPTEVGLQKYLCTSNRKISKVGLVSCSARILPAGTILLTTRAGIGDLGILKFDAATNQGFQNLLPNPEVDNEFIYYLMQTKKSELIKNASGSTFLEISPRKLKAIEVSIPPLFEQKKIATILREFDENIEVFNTKMIKLKLQKKGMMQALLTGSIRIS